MGGSSKATSVPRGNRNSEPWYDKVTSAAAALRRRSQLAFYLVAGLLGALAGLLTSAAAVLLAQFALAANEAEVLSRSLTSVMLTGLRFGVYAGIVGTTLYIAMRRYQHQKLRWKALSGVVASSLSAGAVSGSALQVISNGLSDTRNSSSAVVDVAASILVAVLLGVILSQTVPNLPPTRGLAAGLSAALISLLCVAVLAVVGTPTDLTSTGGLLALGPALGFALALAETRFREAIIQVDWAPDDSTWVGLGSSPLSIGGGKDDIYIPGAPANISKITLQNGAIEHVETASGKRTSLQDGNRLRINGLTMVVRIPKTSTASKVKSRTGK